MKSIGIMVCISCIMLAGRDPKLIGTWQSADDESAFLKFESDGVVTLYSENDTLGGKRFYNEDDEEFQRMTYETSGKGDTLMIDFILTNLDTQKEVARAKGLYTLRQDSLIFGIDGFGDPRAETIDKVDAFLFVRVKKR